MPLGNSPIEVSTGSYTGTGAAQTITCGFKPSKVTIFNDTDGDALVLHWDTMAAGTACAVGAAAAKISSQGITLTDRGFTVGTDNNVSESGKTFVWHAIK